MLRPEARESMAVRSGDHSRSGWLRAAWGKWRVEERAGCSREYSQALPRGPLGANNSQAAKRCAF